MNEEHLPRAGAHHDRAVVKRTFARLRAWKRGRRVAAPPPDAPVQLVRPLPPDVPVTPSVTAGHRFFSNPTSYVRAYDTLERVELHPALRAPLLHCQPTDPIVATDGVVLVQRESHAAGTAHALHHLAELMTLPTNGPKSLRRVLVCGPTNALVDAAWEEFRRETDQKKHKIRALRTTQTGRKAQEHQAPTALSTYRGKLVVFATLAGRNSPQLRDLDFDAVLVLGAHLPPEYETWALLRATTRHLCLVGCAAPQAVAPHERSMFQRLAEAGYALA